MKPKNQSPTAAEHAQLRAFLAGKGLAPAMVNLLVGAAPAGRSRHEIAAALTNHLRAAPKA